MSFPERLTVALPQPASSLWLRGGCTFGLGLAAALLLAAILLQGNAVRIMFSSCAVVVTIFTWAAWHYFHLPTGHDAPVSDEQRRHHDAAQRDKT